MGEARGRRLPEARRRLPRRRAAEVARRAEGAAVRAAVRALGGGVVAAAAEDVAAEHLERVRLVVGVAPRLHLDLQLLVVELRVVRHPPLAQVRREALAPLGRRLVGRRRVPLLPRPVDGRRRLDRRDHRRADVGERAGALGGGGVDGLGVGAVGGRCGDEELLLPSGERQGAPRRRHPVGMDGGGEGGEEGGARVARADHGEVRLLRQVRETLGAPEAAERLLPPECGVGGAVAVGVAGGGGVVGGVEVAPEAGDAALDDERERVDEEAAARGGGAGAAGRRELADDEAADGGGAAHGELLGRHQALGARGAQLGLRRPDLLAEAARHRLRLLGAGGRRRRVGGGGRGAAGVLALVAIPLHLVDRRRRVGVEERRRLVVVGGGEAPPPRGAERARARQLPLDHLRLAREELEAVVLDGGAAGAAGEDLGPRRKVRELADRPRRAVGLEDARRVDRVLEAPRHRRPLAEAQLLVHHAARPQQPAAARERVLGVGLADGVDLGVGGAPRGGGGGGGPEEELVARRQRPLRAERPLVLVGVVRDADDVAALADVEEEGVRLHLGHRRRGAGGVVQARALDVEAEGPCGLRVRQRVRRARQGGHVSLHRQDGEPDGHLEREDAVPRHVDRAGDFIVVLGPGGEGGGSREPREGQEQRKRRGHRPLSFASQLES